MLRRILLFALAFTAVPAQCRDNDSWIEVRSEHFIVATNAGEKKGRQIADQFERMRAVFHTLLPKLQVDPDVPIVVLATKSEKDFRALEPASYLAKGQVRLGGLFLHAPDKNYVLMRLDAEGEHPYEVIYHEYTHLLLSKAAEWMPLWMNEGLAEFYQNTDIREKDVALGQPSAENITLLRQNRILPLTTLFTVDSNSPYYHEENKGSIFYAESWALMHYFEVKQFHEKSTTLADYMDLLQQHVDSVTAATRAFGDLKRLQYELEQYIENRSGFTYFKMSAPIEIDDSTFKARSLAPTETDALRADFLAYNQRTADARALLDVVLRDDPKNVSAHETMGFLAFHEGQMEEARKWYAQAVQLDSQSYLAHYYFAVMSMQHTSDTTEDAQVESSLRAAIKLNPQFAPAFDSLTMFLGMRHRDLEEARMMGLTAISLDPGNVQYRVNLSQVWMEMGKPDNAIRVLQDAAKLAKTPEEIQQVDNVMSNARIYASAQEQTEKMRRAMAEADAAGSPAAVEASASTQGPTLSHRVAFVAKGPHHFLQGTLKNVHCDTAQLDLTVDSKGKTLPLHAENYFKIQFTALDFAPSATLNPCRDLEGRPAKVEYVESADQSATARVLAIELHR
jgi:tetratricopeptide (TPR) repeat protein